MNKIIRAINSMIFQSEKISKVLRNDSEYFFLFDNKYKWSILRREDTKTYKLFYYHGDATLAVLASMRDEEWNRYKEYVEYSSEDLKTDEANDTFSELYLMIKEKALGINKVLDDIIGKDF